MTITKMPSASATGGYAANAEMWEQITPQYPLTSYCNPFSRGDGIRAAEEIGFTKASGNAFVGGMSLMPALTFGRLLGQKILNW